MTEENKKSPPSEGPPQNHGLLARGEVREAMSFLKTFAFFIVAIVFLRASVVEAFKIPSGSMIPTLQIGDHILVSKLSYGVRLPFVIKSVFQYSYPRRGDIVVFTRPDELPTREDESEINIIKRVVGLPGDQIEVHNKKVYINGESLDEDYARWEEGGIIDGNFGPERVPEGHIFLLGDNRDHSKDSRFWEDHFLNINRVKGRALVIYWSWHDLSRIFTLIH